MAEIIKGSKSSVLEQKVNQYEMAMKEKFVAVVSKEQHNPSGGI